MAGFLLDTDIISFFLRGQGNAGFRMFVQDPDEMFVSPVTVAELEFGAARKQATSLQRRIDLFLDFVRVLPLDQGHAKRFGAIAAHLERMGTPIGLFDTLIAAQALSNDLTLVSNNTKHFSRVPGLKLENWL